MTKYGTPDGAGQEAPRCLYCRRPLPPGSGPGRPRRYCRRSHRQRAYEARRRAAALRIPEDQLVVSKEELDRLHDRLYTLESALDDVDGDLAGKPRDADFKAAFRHLYAAASDLRGVVVEPVVA